jgi:transposase-like protein
MGDDRVPGAEVSARQRWICPTCGRQYIRNGQGECAVDKTALVKQPR